MLAAHCLAIAMYYEARNQPIDGQLAVAQVIMNRVESPRYPDTVCEVVWQPKQFSFTHDGLPERPKHHSWGGHTATSRLGALRGLYGLLRAICYALSCDIRSTLLGSDYAA